jgi:cytochrome b involved in lipid metabolism
MDDVKMHATDKSCWTVIDGKVYDLTKWVYSHPGGSGAIRSICGVDGTSAFTNQHEGRRAPIQELSKYLLGPLSK